MSGTFLMGKWYEWKFVMEGMIWVEMKPPTALLPILLVLLSESVPWVGWMNFRSAGPAVSSYFQPPPRSTWLIPIFLQALDFLNKTTSSSTVSSLAQTAKKTTLNSIVVNSPADTARDEHRSQHTFSLEHLGIPTTWGFCQWSCHRQWWFIIMSSLPDDVSRIWRCHKARPSPRGIVEASLDVTSPETHFFRNILDNSNMRAYPKLNNLLLPQDEEHDTENKEANDYGSQESISSKFGADLVLCLVSLLIVCFSWLAVKTDVFSVQNLGVAGF